MAQVMSNLCVHKVSKGTNKWLADQSRKVNKKHWEGKKSFGEAAKSRQRVSFVLREWALIWRIRGSQGVGEPPGWEICSHPDPSFPGDSLAAIEHTRTHSLGAGHPPIVYFSSSLRASLRLPPLRISLSLFLCLRHLSKDRFYCCNIWGAFSIIFCFLLLEFLLLSVISSLSCVAIYLQDIYSQPCNDVGSSLTILAPLRTQVAASLQFFNCPSFPSISFPLLLLLSVVLSVCLPHSLFLYFPCELYL